MERIAAADLEARLAWALEDPLVVVDDAHHLDPQVVSRLAGLPAVFVAFGRPPGPLDVGAQDEVELQAIVDAVQASPLAAVALAVLLRGSELRSVGEGLAAESATYSMLQAGPKARAWLATRVTSRRPAVAELDPVRVERSAGRLVLTLDRPERRNALGAAMRDALLDGLAVAAAEPDVQVVLRGEGPVFCAGGDLAEFGTADDPAAAHVVRLGQSVGRALAGLAGRTTVHVHGTCVGAGVELPAFAGRVVAAPDTCFALPELSMGLVPGAGGTVSLPRRIGRHRTCWLALTGSRVDVSTAAAWGLVDEVVES